MHPSISLFPSLTFYGGGLSDGVTVADRSTSAFPWPGSEPLVFYASSSQEERPSASRTSWANTGEAQLVVAIASRLLEGGASPSDIAVITPYAGQRRVIKDTTHYAIVSTLTRGHGFHICSNHAARSRMRTISPTPPLSTRAAYHPYFRH
ncbi:hypothetical protein AB1Y20_018386 [Prymnesium parvum]|uniref:DNA2/NAM7 helicase-like C-terminal domain-containing protein n=1 Tax=Prymnesium parvum TaxID=97485 RepID=A0AB34JNP5_PRYPA